jgi:cell division protein ZapA
MQGRTVQLRVGGQTYRVVTSASEDELRRLAAVVDQKLAAVVPPGRAVSPQAMLLAAMALAHDLEEAQAHQAAFTAKARGAFGRLIERVDAALEDGAAKGAPPEPAPKSLRQLDGGGLAGSPAGGPAGHPANES